jgi:hypothetical protein
VIRAKVANFVAFFLVAAISLTAKHALAQFPPNQSQSAAFTGAWCAQGDPTKHASISSNGAFLTLTNNTIGGTVSTNGNRINWDNGTYWIRFRVYGSQNN